MVNHTSCICCACTVRCWWEFISWAKYAASMHFAVGFLSSLFTTLVFQCPCLPNSISPQKPVCYLHGGCQAVVITVHHQPHSFKSYQVKSEMSIKKLKALKCKPSAHYACAVSLIDGLGQAMQLLVVSRQYLAVSLTRASYTSGLYAGVATRPLL